MKANFKWVEAPDIQVLINALTLHNKATFQFVGGCVRDSFLGIPVKDIDVASTLSPEENIQLLTTHNIKVIPYALKYGTILAKINNHIFEITTLRKDIATYGRKADVLPIDNYKTDAKRRDFTFNSLYLHPLTFKVTDYFNGLKDLKMGKVRFIGNISTRIKEDYLRILRFVRVYTLYSKTKYTLLEKDIIIRNTKNLSLISKERITLELNKIILSKKFIKGLKALNDLNISYTLFNQPKLHYLRLSKLKKLSFFYQEPIPLTLKWLAVIDNPEKLKEYIKLTQQETNYVNKIIQIISLLHLNNSASYLLAYFSNSLVIESILLALSKINNNNPQYSYLTNLLKEVKHKKGFNFPITGKDLLHLNIPPGKVLGDILYKLKVWGLEHNIQEKHQYLIKAKQLIKDFS